jgi:hypothetical protein
MLLCVASTQALPSEFKAGTLVALYDPIHAGTGYNGTGVSPQKLFVLFVNTKLQLPQNVTANYQLTVVVQIGVCLSTPLSPLYFRSLIDDCTHLCHTQIIYGHLSMEFLSIMKIYSTFCDVFIHFEEGTYLPLMRQRVVSTDTHHTHTCVLHAAHLLIQFVLHSTFSHSTTCRFSKRSRSKTRLLAMIRLHGRHFSPHSHTCTI